MKLLTHYSPQVYREFMRCHWPRTGRVMVPAMKDGRPGVAYTEWVLADLDPTMAITGRQVPFLDGKWMMTNRAMAQTLVRLGTPVPIFKGGALQWKIAP